MLDLSWSMAWKGPGRKQVKCWSRGVSTVKGTNQDGDEPSTPGRGEVMGRLMSPKADESSRSREPWKRGPLLALVAVCSQDQSGHLGGQGC